jgi:PIN domain nuclease of toxin-antitoxin system
LVSRADRSGSRTTSTRLRTTSSKTSIGEDPARHSPWLWLIGDVDRLTPEVRATFADGDSELYLSVVAVWEIAIKAAAGNLRYIGRPEVLVPQHIRRTGVIPLGVSVDHALAAAALPMHHRDPFDRMMIAQAQAEGLTVATADRRFAAYDVPRIEVSA